MKHVETKRKFLLMLSIVLITIQAFVIGFVATEFILLRSAAEQVIQIEDDNTELTLTELVLPQMTRQLQQVRESWLAFTHTYKYDIIKENQIDEQNLKFFLDTSVRGLRAFGPKGDAFVFDSLTGNYYMDYSINIDKINPVTIHNIFSNPQCKNANGVKEFTTSLLWHNDVLDSKYLVNLWSEPDLKYEDAYNLSKYPLGKYNREFVQKIMLPLPNVGERQIVIALSVQEKDITSYLDTFIQNEKIKEMNTSATNLAASAVICIFFSILLIVITNFLLVKAVYSYGDCSSR